LADDQAFKGAKALSKLMRTQCAISGEAADGFSSVIAQVLDLLKDDWNIEL
jgi:hypothetical protein